MKYTCPKCDKKMDLSSEVLINSNYRAVCPQCLSQLLIVGDYAYIPNDTLELDMDVEPSRTINCPVCGHEASTGAHFCPNCGSSFDAEPVETLTPEEVTVLPPPMPGRDPLFNDAVRFLANCRAITPMMLRDHFRITEERSQTLLRELEEAGVVGPYNNGGPRQILIPHLGLYDNNRPVMPGSPMQVPNNGKGQPRRGGIGCFTWFLIITFIIFLTRACAG